MDAILAGARIAPVICSVSCTKQGMHMEILNNPWLVGIGGGVLSGLIVAYISRVIFSRRDNREYAQKISQANHEVLYAVRPGISEGIIPNNGVLKNLISATARKYGVDESDMHDLNSVSSELVKEVMDSSFISAQAKQEFCEKLAGIKEEVPRVEKVEVDREYSISARYRRQMVAMLSGMVGILTALAGLILTLEKPPEEISDPKFLLILLLPAVVAIVLMFVVVMFRELQKMRLKSFNLRLAGINAEFKPKQNESSENS